MGVRPDGVLVAVQQNVHHDLAFLLLTPATTLPPHNPAVPHLFVFMFRLVTFRNLQLIISVLLAKISF